MATVGESGRFVAEHRLPGVPLWVSGSVAYATMVEAQVGALIALDAETPRYLVAARFVKSALDFAAQEISGAAASVIPLSLHLMRFWNPNQGLRAFVEMRFKEAGLSVESAVVEIGEATLMRGHEASVEGPLVQRVFGTAGGSPGWYFAQQATLDTIQTAPDKWLCKNDPPHSNANFDSGKCADCNADLIV
jgi:hypothetical protein